jgi:hypothetical protein
MPEKTIKTDKTVHEELGNLKGKYGVDTFNDVLRLELGIDPGPDIERLSAFLTEKLQEDIKKVTSDIEGAGDFEQGYDRIDSYDYLTFEIPNSGRKVSDIRFRDGGFRVRYRDNSGEMQACIEAVEDDNEVEYRIHSANPDEYNRESARDVVRERVTKSYRRWE